MPSDERQLVLEHLRVGQIVCKFFVLCSLTGLCVWALTGLCVWARSSLLNGDVLHSSIAHRIRSRRIESNGNVNHDALQRRVPIWPVPTGCHAGSTLVERQSADSKKLVEIRSALSWRSWEGHTLE